MPKKRFRTYAAEWTVRITELLHTVCGAHEYSVAAAVAAYSNERLAAIAYVVVALVLIGAVILGVKHALWSARAFLKSWGHDEQETSAETSTPAGMSNGKVGSAVVQASQAYDRNNIIYFPNAQVYVTVNCVMADDRRTYPSLTLSSEEGTVLDISHIPRVKTATSSAPEGIDLGDAA